MNFNSVFEELNKLYESETVAENYENDNGVTAWSKNAISYYEQAAKELGLENYTMKLTKVGGKDKAIVTAVKNGKTLSAEESDVAMTHNVKNVEDAKEQIQFLFPELTESVTTDEVAVEEGCTKESLAEAAEEDEIEIVDDEMPAEEVPAEELEARQLILECAKCGALVIKDEADVVFDEESDLVNVEDECEYCEEKEGYKIIGVVAPYEAIEVEAADEEPVEESLAENFENDSGVKAWSKNAISYYEHAAKELGLADYTMKMENRNGKDVAVVSASKDGKKLSAEESNIQITNAKNVADAKEFIQYAFPELA